MTPEVEADRDERRRDTLIAIRKRVTQVERWSSTGALSADPLWDARAVAAAALVPPGKRVLDLGCGDMKMEALLPAAIAYLPLDVARRDERTIVVDLNLKRLPQVEADFVLGMGVLEYIFDIPSLLRQLARQVPEGLISYHPFELSPKRDRLAVGWVNALSSPELIALFRAAGYKSVEVHAYKPSLHFYRISKAASGRI